MLFRTRAAKVVHGDGLTADRLEALAAHSKDGVIADEADSLDKEVADPFSEISTRAPPTSADVDERPSGQRRKRPRGRHGGRRRGEYYQEYQPRHDPNLYRVYPGLHPKDQSYCKDMRGMFAYTCQPSKPLRIDLVEFCKDYSVFCNIPNYHRLPGPRLGPPLTDNGVGHVDINGKFGFGVGAVPGLEVGVGWGVDVGPIPGMGESVGVGVGLDLGIMGSKTPESYRRGQDDPNQKGGGIVGINGGVGVKAPGTQGVGVGGGVGVGK